MRSFWILACTDFPRLRLGHGRHRMPREQKIKNQICNVNHLYRLINYLRARAGLEVSPERWTPVNRTKTASPFHCRVYFFVHKIYFILAELISAILLICYFLEFRFKYFEFGLIFHRLCSSYERTIVFHSFTDQSIVFSL